MNNKELLEKCIELKCPYGVDYTHQKHDAKMWYQINRHMTLREFLGSNEIEPLKEKYPFCKLRFTLITGSFPEYCFYKFKTGKLYNRNNECLDKAKFENYEIGRDIKIIYDLDIKNLKLQEYIDMMKNFKELYVFRHEVVIDYNNDHVNIFFGENGVLIYDNFEVIEEDHFYYKYPILSIKLLPY